MDYKLLAIRRRIKFYQQIYEYNFLPAKFAHSSWTESINLPTTLLTSDQIVLYQSEQLIMDLAITDNYLDQTNLWLILNSLSDNNLHYVLDQLILTIIFSHNSSLMDGNKIKKFREMFSQSQLKLIFNNKLKIASSVNLPIEINIKADLEIYRYYLLTFIAQNSHAAIKQRYQLRFNKDMTNSLITGFSEWNTLNIQEIHQVARFYLKKISHILTQGN